MVEHFGGAFPTWLAPVQAKVCSISEKQEAYARKVHDYLTAQGVRSKLDIRAEKINYKVRQAEVEKIPYVLAIGDREVESGQVSVRGRGRKDLGTMKFEDFANLVLKEIEAKKA